MSVITEKTIVLDNKNIKPETTRQLLRRLALAWGEEQAKHYIVHLEKVVEAAKTVVNDEGFDKIEGAGSLKEQLKQLEELNFKLDV